MGFRAAVQDRLAGSAPWSSKAARRRWLTALKVVLGVLVVLAVGRHVRRTWYDLHAEGRSVRLDPGWMAAAVVLYLAGLAGFGAFYWKILAASPTPVRLWPAVRAYLISHLGKYVPGKALVIVLRASLVAPYGARPATAAFATLYETLVMMAGGGFLAAAGFAARPTRFAPAVVGTGRRLLGPPWLLSLGLGVAFLIVAAPRVFPRLSAVMSVPFPGVGPEALPRFSWPLLGTGLAWSAAGWTLLGLSQVAVVRALTPAAVAPEDVPLVMASVALATVAGFAIAILPGGLGVRELVIMATLASVVGADLAVVAALALRLAWIAGEVAVAALLFVVRPKLPPPLPPAEP